MREKPSVHFERTFKSYLERTCLTQGAFAKQAGFTPSDLSRLVKGRRKISRDNVLPILKTLLDLEALQSLEEANDLLTAKEHAPLNENFSDLDRELLDRLHTIANPSPDPSPPGPQLPDREERRQLVDHLISCYEAELSYLDKRGSSIPLRFELRCDLTRRPASGIYRDHPPGKESVPSGMSIEQVYEDRLRGFLLLGEPGAGKTTLLTRLAVSLLKRAQDDSQQPIPVVLNLSSWSKERLPLEEWVVEDLQREYKIPCHLGRAWIETQQFQLLLDGLEEVAFATRPACLKAISDYQDKHFRPLVISCRTQEYEGDETLKELGRTHLTLPGTVLIQPVTMQEIQKYLAPRKALWGAFRPVFQKADTSLQKLLQNLFVLRVIIEIYHEKAPDKPLQMGSEDELFQQIFTMYTQRMLERDMGNPSYSPERALSWLSWLAWQMKQHGLNSFYIEDLQPDWLPEPQDYRRYTFFGIRLPAIVLGSLLAVFLSVVVSSLLMNSTVVNISFNAALLGGFLSDLFCLIGMQQGEDDTRHSERGPLHALFPIPLGEIIVWAGALALSRPGAWFLAGQPSLWAEWLLDGLLFGLSGLVVFCVLFKGLGDKGKEPQRQLYLLYGMLTGVLLGGGSGIAPFISSFLLRGMSQALVNGLTATISSALIFGCVGPILGMYHCRREGKNIHPSDKVELTRKSIAQSLANPGHLKNALMVAGIVGILGVGNFLSLGIFGARESLVTGLADGGLFALGSGLIYWMAIGFFYGIVSKTVDERDATSETMNKRGNAPPNQRMRRSFHHALYIGAITGLVSGLTWFLSGFLTYTPSDILHYGLHLGVATSLHYAFEVGLAQAVWFGLTCGLASGLVHGGEAVLRQSVLRFLLCTRGLIPHNYPEFLDTAIRRDLVKKLGGGYSFLHDSLRDYLASVWTHNQTKE